MKKKEKKKKNANEKMNCLDEGEPHMLKGDEKIAIPSQIDGLVVEKVADYVLLRAQGLGFTIRWDTKVNYLKTLTLIHF